MSINEALADVRDALIAGDSPADALALAAEDHGLTLTLLTNRAKLAYGDLDTYAARTAATRTISPDTQRKLALGAVRESIQKLGEVATGSEGSRRLYAAVAEANALGGRFTVKHCRRHTR